MWRLKDQIAQVRSLDPDGKVIIIAHSMGGLVSRVYIEAKAFYENDVKTLFTLGSPHQGIPSEVAEFILSINGYASYANYNYCEDQIAFCQMSTGIDRFNRVYSTRGPGIDYYLVSGNLAYSDASWSGAALRKRIDGPDDGLIQVSSGLGLNGRHQALVTDEAHNNSLGHPTYFVPRHEWQAFSSAYADCIQPVLEGNPDGCQSSLHSSRQHEQETNEPSSNALTPPLKGTINSNDTASHIVSLDGSGNALFTASWLTGTITFTLTSPTGQIIDPAYAMTHPSEVSYLQAEPNETPVGASYFITTTAAGEWTMNLQAGLVPEGSTDYTLFTAMESPITLTLQTDKQWYEAGQVATITAMLGGSIANADIEVQIERSDQVIDTLTLVSQGDGTYQGAYSVPSASGYVTIRGVADETDSCGHAFARQAVSSFQIASSAASLTENYAEFALPAT